jgi:predicted nucleic acid-binding protein
MARFIDPFYTNNFLDANIFDEIAGGKEAVLEILRIYDEESITLILPYSVQAELGDPSTPTAVKKASQQFIYSIQVSLTDGEKKLYEKLLAVVTGDSKPENIARDLFHVFEAQKNGGGHFITRDKRLLKRGDAIADLLGVEVLTPEAFVAKVREAQARSEEFERRKKEFERGT